MGTPRISYTSGGSEINLMQLDIYDVAFDRRHGRLLAQSIRKSAMYHVFDCNDWRCLKKAAWQPAHPDGKSKTMKNIT